LVNAGPPDPLHNWTSPTPGKSQRALRSNGWVQAGDPFARRAGIVGLQMFFTLGTGAAILGCLSFSAKVGAAYVDLTCEPKRGVSRQATDLMVRMF
jgi:hypothetical protein